MPAAAEASGISRATAYRYFSDATTLAAEAALDLAVTPTEVLLEGLVAPRERAHAIRRYYLGFAVKNETAFRAFLARTMQDWLDAPPGTRPQLRGARRIPAFETALLSERPRLGAAAFRQMILCLTAATGLEQHIALSDVCALDPEAAEAVSVTTTDAILDRFGVR
ncbi:hypothetical protein ACW9UR_07260 [Halovulum sp. GXIMD14794]